MLFTLINNLKENQNEKKSSEYNYFEKLKLFFNDEINMSNSLRIEESEKDELKHRSYSEYNQCRIDQHRDFDKASSNEYNYPLNKFKY